MKPDRLRPLIRYFGSKWGAAKRYPAPRYDSIVEPFAGGAGYSLHYFERDVILSDVYPAIVGVWQLLTSGDVERVARLPLLEPGEAIPDWVQNAERDLMGFWCTTTGAHPQSRLVPCAWRVPSSYWGSSVRDRLCEAMPLIRHWTIVEASYHVLPNETTTWFVDPPYQRLGNLYGTPPIDFAHLGQWCQTRRGQVIVCENEGATWLPFKPFGEWHAATRLGKRGTTKEVIWTGGA